MHAIQITSKAIQFEQYGTKYTMTMSPDMKSGILDTEMGSGSTQRAMTEMERILFRQMWDLLNRSKVV